MRFVSFSASLRRERALQGTWGRILRIAPACALVLVVMPAAAQQYDLLLRAIGAPEQLCRVARRSEMLRPTPPPGADHVVTETDMVAPPRQWSSAA